MSGPRTKQSVSSRPPKHASFYRLRIFIPIPWLYRPPLTIKRCKINETFFPEFLLNGYRETFIDR